MAWDSTKPTDSEKLRVVPSLIRNNFQAVEDADDIGIANMLEMRSAQLYNRQYVTTDDPTTSAGTQYLYCRNDNQGVQETFTKDSAGNIIQLTNDGNLGSLITRVQASSISFDGALLLGKLNVVPAWGFVQNNILAYGSGVTSALRPGIGTYVINLESGTVKNTNYSVFGMGSKGVTLYSTTIRTLTHFTVTVRNSSVAQNNDFFFIVIGGQ